MSTDDGVVVLGDGTRLVEVDSRWARPWDRVRMFRLTWRAAEASETVPVRRRVRRMALAYALKPTARASWDRVEHPKA